MEKNGGYATLQQLNRIIDTSSWGTKTPDVTIRRIVQENKEFFKIKAGLWALVKLREKVLKRLNICSEDFESDDIFTHSYYQGMVVNIGNIKKYNTYIPLQDKNKKFLEKRLSELTSLDCIPQFTYKNLLRYAKTVDVIWFNERLMPCGFYEIEHTTNIKNSLNKFYELQDFRAAFFIIADEKRRNYFNDTISSTIYDTIRKNIKFISYENLAKQYLKESIVLSEKL